MEGEFIDWVNCHPVDKIACVYALRLASEDVIGKFLNKSLTSPDWLDDFST